MKVKIASENEHKNKCSSYALYIVLFSIISTINIGIATYFDYYKYRVIMKKTFEDMIISIKQRIININGKSQTN